MRKNIFLLFALFTCNSLPNKSTAQVNDSVMANAGSGKARILIINSFDAQAAKYRNNKKELFAKLADSLKSLLADQIRKDNSKEPVIIQELFPPVSDSIGAIDSLMNLYNANAVIVIKHLDAFFV